MTSTKMTKQLTLLLAIVFSWLFVGSLIIFHQEHVLGKHSIAISQHYIVPKTKEDQSHSLNQLPSSERINLCVGDMDTNHDVQTNLSSGTIDKLIISPVGLFSDYPPRVIHGLRAPPAA